MLPENACVLELWFYDVRTLESLTSFLCPCRNHASVPVPKGCGTDGIWAKGIQGLRCAAFVTKKVVFTIQARKLEHDRPPP